MQFGLSAGHEPSAYSSIRGNRGVSHGLRSGFDCLWGNQPIFGWDALKFWMPAAVDLIEVSSQPMDGIAPRPFNIVIWQQFLLSLLVSLDIRAILPATVNLQRWIPFRFFLAIFAAYHWRAVTGMLSFSILAMALLTY